MKNKYFILIALVACAMLFSLVSCDLLNFSQTEEHQHSLTEHEGKAPTCTKKGYETYYTCSCGRGFSDAEAKNQIKSPVVLSALGHDCSLEADGELEYSDSTGYYDATGLDVIAECSRCEYSEKLELFSVKPNEAAAGGYIISAEVDGKAVSTVFGSDADRFDCVCTSFKVGGTLVYSVADGYVDTDALVISDAVCSDCGNEIAEFSVDVSKAFTDGIVVSCGGAKTILPALTLDNYTVSSARTGGNDPSPVVTTSFTAKDSSYVCEVITDNYIETEGTLYSRYELSLLCNDNVDVSYDGSTYTYEAKNSVTLTKAVRTYGCMLTLVGDITLNLDFRWTHNNGIIFGTDEKTTYVKVTVTASTNANALYLWDGADIIINEGSTLETSSSDSYNIWTGAKGTHITVDGTLITHGHIFIAPDIDWVHPEGDNYNSNPNLYIRKGTAEINGNVFVNFIQVGSVKNNYTGKLTVKNGMIGCFSNTGDLYNKKHQIRWIFSKGELNFENTGSTIQNAMKTDQDGKERIIVFDEGIKVTATGSYTYLLAHGWSSWSNVAIHTDAKFALPAETNVYNQAVNYASYNVNFWNSAAITLDGTVQTVWVANESQFKAENATAVLTQEQLLPVINGDGTRSAAKVVPAEGSYTTTDGNTVLGDWETLFKKAVTDNGDVIYYYAQSVEAAHECESVCSECGKCFNTDCAEEVCKAKCSCYSDEVLGKVDDGFIYNLMSFNIRTLASESNPINNWESRKEAVVSFINNSHAHIIGLQEVRKSQFDYINNNLSDKYKAVYFPREGGDNPEGLAIVLDATVFNIVSDDRYWLSDTPDVQSKGWGESYYRIALVLVLENKLNGEFVKTINTHGPLNDVANTNAYKLIMDRSVNENDPFVFLCGDFNATEGAIGYVPVADELQDCRVTADESPNRGHITYQGWGSYVDGETPEHIIDFCFVSKGEGVDVLNYRVRTDRWGSGNMISDHYAVQTTVLVK